MAWFGKYKWSFIAVAVLLLLALHRTQMSRDQDQGIEFQRPTSHERVEPQYAAIPKRDAAQEVHSIQSQPQTPYQDGIERFAMANDGGDFQALELDDSPTNNEEFAGETSLESELQLGDPTPELVSSDETLFQPAAELRTVNTETTNPVLQHIENPSAARSKPALTVESVRDFEPAFATNPPTGPVNLPRGVLVKVVNHIEYGKSLARRGAAFGARQEFIAALKLVAQSIDQMRGGNRHSDAFFEAIQALKEADDFYNAQSEQHRKVDVVAIAKGHQSKVADPDYLTGLNPMQAMQMYYDFVQDRLVACSGNTVVAGEALYSLGKLHQVNAKDPIQGSQLDNAKSIVHYKAAINCDPKSYKSANELGVFLAKSGRYEEAKAMFIQSLKVHQISKVWANLAKVHEQLGEKNLAQLADVEYRRMLEGPASNQIIWVQPENFANQNNQQMAVRTANAAPPQTTSKEKKSRGRGLKNMMKKLF